MPVDLIKFINHISLNFTLIVHLLLEYIDQILQTIKILKKSTNKIELKVAKQK